MNITITYFEDMMITALVARIISSYTNTTFAYRTDMQGSVAIIDAQGINKHCLTELEEAVADKGVLLKVKEQA